MPFAIWGLHEAWLVTGDEFFGRQKDGLTQFILDSQIQVVNRNTSDSYLGYLDGGWFRGFDFNRSEYFASSSDIGWGPYSIESGWTVGEIMGGFGLIHTNQSFWDLVTVDTLPGFDDWVTADRSYPSLDFTKNEKVCNTIT